MNKGTVLSLIAAIVAGGLASVRSLQRGEIPSLKIAIGALGMGIILSLIATTVPELGVPFALLALVSSMVVYGPDTIKFLSGRL